MLGAWAPAIAAFIVGAMHVEEAPGSTRKHRYFRHLLEPRLCRYHGYPEQHRSVEAAACWSRWCLSDLEEALEAVLTLAETKDSAAESVSHKRASGHPN